MKTLEIKLYKFEELSDSAKERAINDHYDINVDYDWWQFTYDDAETIGLKLTGFDIDRASYCNGEFMLSANEVAQNIFNEHGEMCDTYKTAESFMNEWQPLFNDYMDENSDKYESREAEDDLRYLEDEFLKYLLEDYLHILRREYEYLTSEEAIIESLVANEYDFTEGGKIF